MKTFLPFCAIVTLPLALIVDASEPAEPSQTIQVARSLQIPGATLKPGSYTLSVEDRLPDRAIVRIANASNRDHRLLLTIPNARISTSTKGQIVLFKSADNKEILRAWSCPGCDRALEMVYPKSEAAQVTADTGQSVMAADPAYDRLPADLSADDMKVVTLWLLSPERISNHRGVGVTGAKYTPQLSEHPMEISKVSSPANLPHRHRIAMLASPLDSHF